jgi:uncharacterized damage-inducible protein DinB
LIGKELSRLYHYDEWATNRLIAAAGKLESSRLQKEYQQIQHVLFHSMYHRGQVVTLLRQLGEVPPQTDLIAYYRSVK